MAYLIFETITREKDAQEPKITYLNQTKYFRCYDPTK